MSIFLRSGTDVKTPRDDVAFNCGEVQFDMVEPRGVGLQ
jgi:hypothetical protein